MLDLDGMKDGSNLEIEEVYMNEETVQYGD